MKAIGRLTGVILLLIVLSACGDARISLNEDGSGDMQYRIITNDFVTEEEIQEEFQSELDRSSFEEDEVITDFSVTSDEDYIYMDVAFSSMDIFEGDLYMIPAREMETDENDLMIPNEDIDLEDDRYINIVAAEMYDETIDVTIEAPGEIVAASSNVHYEGNEAYIMARGPITITYQTNGSGSVFAMAGGAVFVAVGGFFVWRRFGSKRKEDGNAVD
ncbi:hypothetical protein [Alkalicoccus daliensis]|uniref:Uncharacterized protein n=1 Tax=Alkalicoccus daliensis TaxID=745820 RepID=A0A1H0GBF2_9BACI|nr:hypothetical protein [Alkalicoccus daliensis]SDO04161.1 hypothetical protein SAMN04488053_10644 [Alkalicoccus daliensis]